MIWSHFKHSSILLASKYFKSGDYEKTEKILAEVPNPDRLARNRRGYYEFMRANIALKREEYEDAERHFQIASRFPLGGKNDKAFVMIHLANLALRKKTWNVPEPILKGLKNWRLRLEHKRSLVKLSKKQIDYKTNTI